MITGEGAFFFLGTVGYIFVFLALLLCRVVLSISYIQCIRKRKQALYLGYARTYGMRRSGCFPEWAMEPLAIVYRLITPNAVDRHSW